eukprot:TRINITY_DN25579_c0_g1_i1.p1 TRINITY_DN25579_c0_g1~~TRINITY_DN25579_c0_g1_i1.p1  ORF type:complete len:673 (-),score=81.68 TRINITY_DN25579_c0_g1_i1:100-2118(-)
MNGLGKYVPLPNSDLDLDKGILSGAIATDSNEIVQFCSSIYYALEGDENGVEIDLIRFGAMDVHAEVRWRTVDGSALAGVKYNAAEGVVTFAPGESVKTINIELIDDSTFSTTVEFRLELFNPSGCILGNYLKQCRVKIIDDDGFPTNRFKTEIQAGNLEEIPLSSLMFEFCKFNIGNRGVRWRTVATMLLDLTHNAYYFLTLQLNVYMVDVLFSREEESEEELFFTHPTRLFHRDWDPREQTAIVVGLLYVIPYVLVLLSDIAKLRLDLLGKASAVLQNSLFRKYLNYTEEVRSKAPPNAIEFAVLTECTEIVECGYMKIIALFRLTAKLLIVGVFVYRENRYSLIMMLVLPFMMLLWACARTGKMKRLVEATKQCELSVRDFTREMCTNYRIMADYNMRPMMGDKFSGLIQTYWANRLPFSIARQISLSFPTLLFTLALGILIVMAPALLAAQMSLGGFLTLISITQELGREFKEAYVELLEVLDCAAPLQQVIAYMMAETELPKRRELHIAARKTLQGFRARYAQEMFGSKIARFDLDSVPLMCDGLRFRYSTIAGPNQWLVNVEKLEVAQGTMVAIQGPHGGGKSTFMRIIAQIVPQTQGNFFVPTHLRVLHVANEPLILKASIWQNITFGCISEDPKRVRRILLRMELIEAAAMLDKELITAQNIIF